MTCTLLGMGFTFVVTIGGVGFLGWLALRRLTRHFQGNSAATHSFIENVLLPLLGVKAEEVEDGEQEDTATAASKP